MLRKIWTAAVLPTDLAPINQLTSKEVTMSRKNIKCGRSHPALHGAGVAGKYAAGALNLEQRFLWFRVS